MIFNKLDGSFSFKEQNAYNVANPITQDFEKPITEAAIGDLQVKNINAIYPLINAINSERLTRNYTFYPRESLMKGYPSFALPYGKPIIREHRSSDSEYAADTPMGRIVASSYVPRGATESMTTPTKKSWPGTVEGNGTLKIIAAITDEDAKNRILGGAYHTVSIGSKVESVIESISGKDLAELARDRKQLPPYAKGQEYNGKLSYYTMGPIEARETSFVNVPSDEYARVVNPDIGRDGIRLFLGEKKLGKTNEFAFYDAITSERLDWNLEEMAFDTSYLVDSANVGKDIWWINGKEYHNPVAEESATLKEESIVTWAPGKSGKIVSICTEGKVPGVPISAVGTEESPVAKIQVMKDGELTERFVAHKVSLLKLV